MQADARRILVLDDEEGIRFLVSHYLSLQGYLVDSAPDLDQAEVLVTERTYDLVIADFRMAGSDGGDMLAFAKRTRTRQPGTRVVVLTGAGGPETEAAARERDVHAVLYKPLPLAELAQIVDELIQKPA